MKITFDNNLILELDEELKCLSYGVAHEGAEMGMCRRHLKKEDRVVYAGSGKGVGQALCSVMVGGSEYVAGYEANPKTVEVSRNVDVDGVLLDVTHAALAPRSEELVELSASARPSYWATTSAEGDVDEEPHSKIFAVPAVGINEAIEKKKANVLILDVEGFEKRIIPALDLSPLDLLILETHTAIIGEKAENDLISGILNRSSLTLLEMDEVYESKCNFYVFSRR